MFCEKAFKQYSHLRTHKLRRTGEKPFKCMFCEKALKHSFYLRTNKLSHTGETIQIYVL